MIRHLSERFWEDEHLKTGMIWSTPHVRKADLWKTSGHLDFYAENVSPIEIEINSITSSR